MSIIHLDTNERFDELESSESSEVDSQDAYKELEHIYNKLIVTNGKNHYGPPMQRTLIPGAHARKLGIRLKTAKKLSEKCQTARPRLNTAAPRVGVSSPERVDVTVTALPNREGASRPSFLGNKTPQKLSKLVDRKLSKSAPPGRVQETSLSRPNSKKTDLSTVPTIPAQSYSSLAMYSPQTQRFTIEQLAVEQSRMLKRLSNIQTHRVDKRFYVSGAPCNIKDRYNIDDEQYALLMDITNKGKSANKTTGLNLSKSILQHFSPQLEVPKSLSRLSANKKDKSKRVSLKVSHSKKEQSKSQAAHIPAVDAKSVLLSSDKLERSGAVDGKNSDADDQPPPIDNIDSVQPDVTESGGALGSPTGESQLVQLQPPESSQDADEETAGRKQDLQVSDELPPNEPNNSVDQRREGQVITPPVASEFETQEDPKEE